MQNLSRLTLTLTHMLALTLMLAESGPAVAADEDPLSILPRSDALAANLAWHNETSENEIRMSWFLDGKPNVAMVCRADLSSSTVTTWREVYDWAHQGAKTRELSDAQVKRLARLAKGLPSPANVSELESVILVSVLEDGRVRTYLYDRTAPPRDVVRLYDLTGAPLGTE